MPQYSGRRRAPSHRHRGPARTPGRVSAPRNDPREDQRSDLDRALTAAAAAAAPAATTFRELGLPARLTDALTASGMVAPFATFRASAIPDAVAGRDVLGRAQTGSGRTLAFGLPMLARLADGGTTGARRHPGTRPGPDQELAVQVAWGLAAAGRRLGVGAQLTVSWRCRDRPEIDRLRRGIDIVVATPGRLIDLIDRTACTLGDVEITPSSMRPTTWLTSASCPL